IGGGGFALDVGVGGDDGLLDFAIGQAAHQFADAQVIGADAVDRIDRPAEHVVPPAEFPGALDGHHILGLLHDAQQAGVAARVAADAALGLFGDVAADLAEPHAGLHLGQCGGQALDLFGIGAEDVEGNALGALGAHSGELAKFVDQFLDAAVVGVHRSPPSGEPRTSSITVPPPRRATSAAPTRPVPPPAR